MKLIKKLTKGNRSLEHHQYIDDMGCKRDSFEIVVTDDKGFRTLIPFFGDIKVKTYSRSSNIMDTTESYTDEEYEKMLDKHHGEA